MTSHMNHNFTVGWICALPCEMAAAVAMLDEQYGIAMDQTFDTSNYRFGRIGQHQVVIACLPAGVYGTASAAVVAVEMLSRYPSIVFGLMVGIGGGVPSIGRDIRLGDVVVSKPSEGAGGVIQYDLGRTIATGKLVPLGHLNKPPRTLLSSMSCLITTHMTEGSKMGQFLAEMLERFPRMQEKFIYQGEENDVLYEAEYEHRSGATCALCDASRTVKRPARPDHNPVVHYGTVASGNQVMKHALTRDRLKDEHGVICLEMEAAGLMDNFPCIVIRGICDYADSHKNKRWQEYAAATAAAYAKELLYATPQCKRTDNQGGTTAGEYQSNPIVKPSPGICSTTWRRPGFRSMFTFTDTLYAKDEVLLGSLIPDRRYPNQDALARVLIKEDVDFSVFIDKEFNDHFSPAECKSSLLGKLAQRLGVASKESRTSFQIFADECRTYTLRQPRLLFDQLCALDEVRKWLQNCYFIQKKSYFVVGYRTLLNAYIVPHFPTKDHQCQAGDSVGFGLKPLGERIFAVCYRKVLIKRHREIDTAYLKPENCWKLFYNTRGGGQQPPDIMEADIEETSSGIDGEKYPEIVFDRTIITPFITDIDWFPENPDSHV